MSLTQFSEPASRPLAEQHVLVIRLSAMGDVAIMAPVLNALLKQHPQLSVTLLTLAKWAPIFAAIPRLKTVPVETKGIHKGIIGLWRLIQSLKKALTRLENKIFKPLKHSSIRYGEVFAKLGFPITLDPSTVLPKPPKNLEITGADQSNYTTIGIAPFAAHKGKQYPLELMIQALEIFSRLAGKDQKKIRFVFFGGGPVETPKIKALCKQFPHSSHGLSLSFEQELQVIAHLDFMVAMDSGNAHLAAMYAVPTLTLWGNTHPYAGFAPVFQTEKNRLLSDRTTYPGLPTAVFGKEEPKGYEKVMESIAPAAVAEKMSALLREASAD